MNITTAIEIIDAMRADYGLPFLEMLIEMGEMLANDELDNKEAAAIRVFLREGRKLFAPSC